MKEIALLWRPASPRGLVGRPRYARHTAVRLEVEYIELGSFLEVNTKPSRYWRSATSMNRPEVQSGGPGAKLKVLHVINTLSGGGAEVFVTDLALALRDRKSVV